MAKKTKAYEVAGQLFATQEAKKAKKQKKQKKQKKANKKQKKAKKHKKQKKKQKKVPPISEYFCLYTWMGRNITLSYKSYYSPSLRLLSTFLLHLWSRSYKHLRLSLLSLGQISDPALSRFPSPRPTIYVKSVHT